MRRRHYLPLAALAALEACSPQDSVSQLAMPVEPTRQIIEEATTGDLIAITFERGYEEEYEVLRSLLDAPEFSSLVDDIVIQFGASRYQDTIDAFIGGGTVAYPDLEKVWQDTTQPHDTFDPPIYERFLRAVREVNFSLAEEDQFRVVAAEPPIDWDSIEDYDDLLPWLQQRFPYEAEVVEREVLNKGRKALLLSGGLHFANGTPLLNAIETHGASIFRVWTIDDQDLTVLQPNVESWPVPSLALLAGTPLGAADTHEFYMAHSLPPGPFEDQYDAILYLGPGSELTRSVLATDLCSDQEYLDMRLPRLRIAAEGGANFLDEFMEYCESVRDSP